MPRLNFPIRLLTLLALLAALGAAPTPATAPSEPGAELRIYVITIGPGDAVWEKFGHNAIRVVDRNDPSIYGDISFNWGLFNFNESDFFPRFIQGTMNYWMGGFKTNLMLEDYQSANRTILQQELNLSPRQKLDLRDFLMWNAQPENRHYHYDYYRDNCSTRLRDAIDRSVGGQIRHTLQKVTTQTTYRSHTQVLTCDDLPVYTTLTYLMGPPTDRLISAYDETFLPDKLMDHLRWVQIQNPAGQWVPLVKSETLLAPSNRPPIRSSPPHWTLAYLLAGLALSALLLTLTRLASHRAARWTFYLLFIPFFLVLGLLATFIVYAWVFSDHWAVAGNENLFQANPLLLLMTLLAPAAIAGKPRARKPAQRLALLMASLALLGLLYKLLPVSHQLNAPIIALLLPLQLTLPLALQTLPPLPSPANKKKRR